MRSPCHSARSVARDSSTPSRRRTKESKAGERPTDRHALDKATTGQAERRLRCTNTFHDASPDGRTRQAQGPVNATRRAATRHAPKSALSGVRWRASGGRWPQRGDEIGTGHRRAGRRPIGRHRIRTCDTARAGCDEHNAAGGCAIADVTRTTTVGRHAVRPIRLGRRRVVAMTARGHRECRVPAVTHAARRSERHAVGGCNDQEQPRQ